MTWIRSDFVDGGGAEILMRRRGKPFLSFAVACWEKFASWAMASSDFYRSLARMARVNGVPVLLYES